MSFSSVVVDIREERRSGGRQQWQLLLEHSEFRVGDTGVLEAVARSGVRLAVPILGVYEENGEIWLRVEKPLMAGTVVIAQIERTGGDV